MKKHILSIASLGWTRFSNLSMQKKLIVVFVFLLTLPITFVSYMSYQANLSSATRSAIYNAKQMTENATDKINRYVTDLKQYTILPLYNRDVQKYLDQQTMDWNKSVNINMFLSYLMNAKEEVAAVYLLDHFGAIFYDKKLNLRELYPEERISQWKKLANQAGGAPVLIGTHNIRVNGNDQRQVFTILRNLQSVTTLKNIGLIAFDIDAEALLKDIIQPLDKVTQGSSLIVDSQGHVIYDSTGGQLSRQVRSHLVLPSSTEHQSHYRLKIDGDSYIAVSSSSAKTGWTTLVYIPLAKLMSPLQQNQNVFILRALSILAFALFVAMIIAYALTHPLKKTVRLMKQVQSGNLDVRVNVKYNDEIGMLGSHFNRMIDRVKDLVEEVHETERRKQKADIHALQNQINPHFIYNTLESIRMLAEMNDDEPVAELTYLLGLLLRYSIVREEETVTVREELNHVQNYLQLLQIRFPGKFKLHLDVPEQMQALPLIKLIFQPIVENAIFHGLDNRPGVGTISITGDYGNEEAVFTIRDDGMGMDASTLHSLNQNLASGGNDKFGIGLRNVHERLRLNYGSASGLQVLSKPGEGTTVRIKLRVRNATMI